MCAKYLCLYAFLIKEYSNKLCVKMYLVENFRYGFYNKAGIFCAGN